MKRRGFLGVLGAAFAAPAVVRAESLMKIFVPKKELIIATSHPVITVDRYGVLTFKKMPETHEDGIILAVASYNKLVYQEMLERIESGILTRDNGKIVFPKFNLGLK